MGLIDLVNVWFTYPGNVRALRGVNLSVEKGEVLSIVGPNGSGKSTLLLVMAGLLEPEEGDVLFEGVSMREISGKVRSRFGVLFQDPDDQLFNPTVFDEIAFTLRQLGLDEARLRERVEEISREFGLAHLLDRPPYRLSYGERKMLALASALAHEPDVILLDEPTAGLGSSKVELIKSIVRRAGEDGRTVVAASHDVIFAAQMSDRICVMVEGRVVYDAHIEGVEVEKIISIADLYPSAGDWAYGCSRFHLTRRGRGTSPIS